MTDIDRRELLKLSPALAVAVASIITIPQDARGLIVTLRDDFEYDNGDSNADEIDSELKRLFPGLKIIVFAGCDVEVV